MSVCMRKIMSRFVGRVFHFLACFYFHMIICSHLHAVLFVVVVVGIVVILLLLLPLLLFIIIIIVVVVVVLVVVVVILVSVSVSVLIMCFSNGINGDSSRRYSPVIRQMLSQWVVPVLFCRWSRHKRSTTATYLPTNQPTLRANISCWFFHVLLRFFCCHSRCRQRRHCLLVVV